MILDPVNSIVNFPFYREVPQRRPLKVAVYLIYLGLLFSISSTVALALRAGPAIREISEWAASSMPTVTYAQGKFSTSSPGPVRLEYPKVPGLALLIDTNRTTAVTPQEMKEQKVIACLTQTAVYILVAEDRMEAHDLSKSFGGPPLVIDAELLRRLGALLPKLLYPSALFLTWGFFFFWKLAAAFIYALLGLIINAMTSGGLEFDALVKLAAYAQTPVVLLQALQLYLPKPVPHFPVIGIIVASVYLWQAVKQNASAVERLESTGTF